jgi:hypothetical protein
VSVKGGKIVKTSLFFGYVMIEANLVGEIPYYQSITSVIGFLESMENLFR